MANPEQERQSVLHCTSLLFGWKLVKDQGHVQKALISLGKKQDMSARTRQRIHRHIYTGT